MYPFDMPGITRKENTKFSFFKSSYVKFALNKDALIEDAVKQLIYDIPPQTKVMFFDISYPSPSDPGAYVSYMRVDNQYIMQRANHGWTNKWEFINAEELKNYLSKCSAIHILGANPFEDMFVYYKIEPPLPEKIISEQEEVNQNECKERLIEGTQKLDPVLNPLGFVFELARSEASSHIPFASGFYINGGKRIGLIYRSFVGFGAVIYEYDKSSVSHGNVMHYLGKQDVSKLMYDTNKLLSYSKDGGNTIDALMYDIQNFEIEFLTSSDDHFGDILKTIAMTHNIPLERSTFKKIPKVYTNPSKSRQPTIFPRKGGARVMAIFLTVLFVLLLLSFCVAFYFEGLR